MFQLLLPCAALVFGGGSKGALEIVEPRATFGHLGAVRPKGAGVLPGDRVHYTFGVKGLTHDDKGQAHYAIGIEIRDGAGKLFYEQKPRAVIAQNFFGGKVLPCSSYIDIPLDTPAGVLNWKVTIEDRLAKKGVSLKGEGKVLPAGFGIVRVGTYADAEGNAPVPPVGVVGSHLYLSFAVVGFGRDQKTKQPDVAVELRIVDDKGKPTFTKPITGRIHEGIGERLRLVSLEFPLTLDRPGRYSLELSARCQHCGASSRVTLPIRILPME